MSRWLPLRISGAARWMACPGSARATHGADDKPTKAAERGTVAHALIEIALRLNLDVEELNRYEGKFLKGQPLVEVDEPMIKSVAHALNYVRSYCARYPDADFHPETAVSLTEYAGGVIITGTSDIVVDRHPEELLVIDYKNGVRRVEVEDNEQVMGYALGYVVRTKKRYKKVSIVIIQPNVDGRPPVVTHAFKMSVLDEFGTRLIRAAKATQTKDAPRWAGKHCTYCRAAGNCKEYGTRALQVARVEFKDLGEDLTMEYDFSNEELARILAGAPMLRHWLESVEAEATDRMLKKQKIPGYQLVQSSPHRRWADEDRMLGAIAKAGDFAMSELAPNTPLSPSKMEKLLTAKRSPHPLAKLWDRFKKQVTTNPVQPKIAKIDDSRKPFIPGSEFRDGE